MEYKLNVNYEVGDLVNLEGFSHSLKSTSPGSLKPKYWLQNDTSGNNESIFKLLNLNRKEFTQNVLEYVNGGDFPYCNSLRDVNLLIDALKKEAILQECKRRFPVNSKVCPPHIPLNSSYFLVLPIYCWDGDSLFSLLANEKRYEQYKDGKFLFGKDGVSRVLYHKGKFATLYEEKTPEIKPVEVVSLNLQKAINEYPIGCDVASGLSGNLFTVQTTPEIECPGSDNIMSGRNFLCYNGKWADIISTKNVDFKKCSRQFILEEVKRRYKFGDKVIPAHVNQNCFDKYIIVGKEENFRWNDNNLYSLTDLNLPFTNDETWGNANYSRVLFEGNAGRWAKKIEKPVNKFKEGDLVVMTSFKGEENYDNFWIKNGEIIELGGKCWNKYEKAFYKNENLPAISKESPGGNAFGVSFNFTIRHATTSEIHFFKYKGRGATVEESRLFYEKINPFPEVKEEKPLKVTAAFTAHPNHCFNSPMGVTGYPEAMSYMINMYGTPGGMEKGKIYNPHFTGKSKYLVDLTEEKEIDKPIIKPKNKYLIKL